MPHLDDPYHDSEAGERYSTRDTTRIDDTRIDAVRPLISPALLMERLPVSEATLALVEASRNTIARILNGQEDRLIVIVGPCSIHDPAAALDYADKLGKLRERYADSLLLCMRGYFEKPRTTVGWKGLINDPDLDGTCDVGKGLRVARKLLLDLAELGMPAANEALDPIMPQYLADVIAWSAIGARTTESQTHREMASGLSMPVGFKNGTDGGLDVAINAMKASREPHSFIGIDGAGQVSVVRTSGNPHSHVVLRGGSAGPNYREADVRAAEQRLSKAGLNARVLIDISHDNSQKKHDNQPGVASDVAKQLAGGNRAILGVMIESNLVAGRQDLVAGKSLVYGQSVTDACIDFTTTENVLEDLARSVAIS